MTSKSNKCLTLDEKMKLIEASEKQQLSVKQICALFKCGKSQVYNVLKRSDEITKLWTNGNGHMKRKPKSNENDKINSLTWEWFVSSRENNEPVSGSMIQAKARQIAEQLSNTKFKASNGWLESFKTRHNISRHKSYQESKKTADVLNVDKPEVKLKLVLKNYELKNIYNVVVSGLLFRALPSQTLLNKSEECDDAKLSNERLSIFLCFNMEGAFEKPLIVGKAKSPRCFKNLDLKTLPIIWRANNKAWMTSNIMDDWLLIFNNKMKKEHRNVILLLDHVKFLPHSNYSNVHIMLLPAYTTSFTQPVNQRIINSVKVNYRKMVLQSFLASVDGIFNVEKLPNNINELDAIYWLTNAINLIKPDAVKKCFIKTGFKSVSDEQTDDLLLDDDFKQLCMSINKEVNCKDYLSIDMNLTSSCNEMDVQKEDDDQSGSDNEIIDNPTGCTNDIKTYENALNEIKRLELFSLNQYHHNDLFEAVLKVKYLLEHKIVCNKIKNIK